MKKLLFSAVFVFAAANCFALEVADTFTYGSRFWRNSLSVMARPYYPLAFGAEFDLTEHKNFDNHVYALRVPIALRFGEEKSFSLRPFYYPDNGNGASAWGGKLTFSSLVNRDDVERSKTKADISAAFAAQDADVLKNGALKTGEDFKQAAYELDINFNFFDSYTFDFIGSVYQYLSGINGVQGVRGVMNQNELSDLGTLDYILGLPDYSAGVKIGWMSNTSRSDNLISYRYIDFHNAGAAHSVLFSTLINLSGDWYMNIAYNHLFRSGPGKDLYAAGLMFKF